MAVLLVLFATEPIWYPAAIQIIQGLPGALQPPLTAFANQLRSWANSFHGWFDQHLQPIAMTLWAYWWAAISPGAALVPMLESLYNSLWRVNFAGIPHALNLAIGHANDLYNRATGERLSSEAQLSAAEAQDHLGAIGHANDLYNQAIWYAAGQGQQAQAYAATLTGQEAGARTAGEARLEQLLNISFQQTETDTSTQISSEAGARAAGEARLQANIDAGDLSTRQLLGGEISSTAQAILAQLGVVASAAAAASAVAEGEIAQIRASECMKFCNILGGLGALLQGAELAGLLALLAKAYEDPEGAAQIVNQDLVQPAEQALGDVLGLFGIKAA